MRNVYESKSMRKYVEDSALDSNPAFSSHGIRTRKHMIVSGPSGSGKTNFIANLLSTMRDAFYEVWIYTAMVDEPVYKMLEASSPNIHVKPIGEVEPYTALKNKTDNKLIVFDDFITAGKGVMKILETYAILSRKIGCSCVYLTQNWFSVPVAIRNQASYIVLLKNANQRNLRLIAGQIGTSLSVSEMSNIIQDATKEKFSVCIIDTLNADRMFRKNFTEYYDV